MRTLRRSIGKAIFGVAAMVAVTSTAQADLILSYSGPSVASNNITLVSGNSIYPFSTAGGNLGQTINFGTAYTFLYDVTTIGSGSYVELQLHGKLVANTTAATSNQFQFKLEGGDLSIPVGGPGTLSSTLNSTFTNNSYILANVLTQAQITDNSVILGGQTSTAPVYNGPLFGYSGAAATTANATTPYRLTSLNTEISGVGSGMTIEFTATARWAPDAARFPEPTGMIAGMAGLPCMGLLLGLTRRLRNGAKTVLAV